MKTRLALSLVAVAVAGTTVIAFSTFDFMPESTSLSDFGPYDAVFVNTADADSPLSEGEAAKIMRVRVSESGKSQEYVFGSFARIGFISGSNEFLLESMPSEDKKKFYKLVQKSLKEINYPSLANPLKLNVKIDIFSGNYNLIHTLSYEKCSVFDYFVHAVDSRGKIPFLDGYEGIEIREVTKFTCQNFDIEFEN